MKSLFPDMERAIQLDRKAEQRERVQRARDYLKDHDLSWLINTLLEHGPRTEHALAVMAMDEHFHSKEAMKHAMDVMGELDALWRTRKLWRKYAGIHPGSGEKSYLYGIRSVHEQEGQAE